MTVTHGGLDPAELRSLGLRPQEVLDFSSNINPLGTSETVIRAVATADLASYPDRNCTALVEALSATLDIQADNLVVGNGATELIHLVSRVTLQPGDRCLIFDPTFGEYAAAAKIAGAEIHRFHAEQSDAFRWDIDRALSTIRTLRPTVVFLCNPNNPSGVYLDFETVERIRASVGATGLLVLDGRIRSVGRRRMAARAAGRAARRGYCAIDDEAPCLGWRETGLSHRAAGPVRRSASVAAVLEREFCRSGGGTGRAGRRRPR